MRRIGFHVSISGGVNKAFDAAFERNINAMQIFLKSSNRWSGKPYITEDVYEYKRKSVLFDVEVFAHSAYLINPASPEEEIKLKSRIALTDELERSSILGIKYLVLHPGSHKQTTIESGIKRAAEMLDYSIESSDSKTMILLETMSGQGDSIGHRFEHLRDIISFAKNKNRLGVCLDTCHIFSAGYHIDEENLSLTIESFKSIIGIEQLKLIHLNDSKNPFASKKDRHENLGCGMIGDAIKSFVADERMREISIIMETPKGDNELESDLKNYRYVKEVIGIEVYNG